MSETNDVMSPPDVSQEDRILAMLTHLSGIVLCFIVPLVVWLIHRDKPERAFLNDQAKEALNFQITIAIIYLICKVLILILIGLLLLPAAWIVNLIFCIVAAIKVYGGAAYRYPFALRLIK